MSAREVQLADPPTDGISSLRFAPSSDLLVAASWDTACRVYDVASNSLRSTYHHKAPVLDATFGSSANVVYSGGLDMGLRM
jgi:WD40 repeat protein